LRGLHRVVWGFLPDLLVLPFVLCAGVAVMRLAVPQHASAALAMSVYVCASALAFAAGAWLLRRAMPDAIARAAPEYHGRAWLRAMLPLMLVSAMYTINTRTDIVMLGAIEGKAAAGVYSTAGRLADFVIFFIVAINAVLAPTAARLHARGDRAGLQRVVTLSARWIAALSIPAALALIIWSPLALSVFGPAFPAGAGALRWLCCGQIVNACAGSVALLLTTTGYERDALRGIAVGAALNVSANAILIPLYGINGAAIATAGSTIVWNTLLAVLVYRRLGINPTMFGRLARAAHPAARTEDA